MSVKDKKRVCPECGSGNLSRHTPGVRYWCNRCNKNIHVRDIIPAYKYKK